MAAKQIVVLGGGFAGLWSAVGAARQLDLLGIGPEAVEVTLVNRDAYHSIRVRNYEPDLSAVRVPLDDVLQPIGVRRIAAEVSGIDVTSQSVTVSTSRGHETLAYDRLVFALGSQLVRPEIPGLAEYSFDVDTYAAADRLNAHLRALPVRPPAAGQYTVVVVGAGLTGIETACEMPARLGKIATAGQFVPKIRVVLIDRNPFVGSDMGESARPVIEQALRDLQIETRTGTGVARVDVAGVDLSSGERIAAATVVWCAGMRAHPLTAAFSVERDPWGRLPVDEFMRVSNRTHVFAAGDVAAAMVDIGHASVMSCQHGRPMGRFAGHNVVSDLIGLPMLPLQIDWYVTVLDLGPWGAVYTEGWNRHVVTTRATAKHTKQIINCQRIYPPLSRNRAEIFAAAAPVVQRPPPVRHEGESIARSPGPV